MSDESREEGCALFIDWENIKYRLRNELGIVPSPRVLRKLAHRYGRLEVARAYADWKDHALDQESLFREGIIPVFALARRMEGETTKNSVDVLLAIECCQLALNNPAIRTVVLVGGDFAYSHLIPEARKLHKRVVVLSATGGASSVLTHLADEFVAYETLVSGVQHRAEASLKPGEQRKRTQQTKEAFMALADAVKELRGLDSAGQRAHEHDAKALKNLLCMRVSDFEEERLGFERFRHFLFAAERRGLLRVDTREEHPVVYGPAEVQTDEGKLLLSAENWAAITSRFLTDTPIETAQTELGADKVFAAIDSKFLRQSRDRDGVKVGVYVVNRYDERVDVYTSAVQGKRKAEPPRGPRVLGRVDLSKLR